MMESNLYGDSVAAMEEIDLINIGFSFTDIYGLSNLNLLIRIVQFHRYIIQLQIKIIFLKILMTMILDCVIF